MSEEAIAHRIAAQLSASARDVRPEMAERLRAARERALAAHKPAGFGLRVRNGLAAIRLSLLSPASQSAAMAVVLVAALLAGDHFKTQSRVSLQQEVDAAILMDDLPIEAYLDADFKTWLLQDSQS